MAVEKKKKIRKNIQTGLAYIQCSFNNTIITITDVSGNTLGWSSAGLKGFRGSKKSTPYAAQMAAEDAGKKAKEYGLRTLSVYLRGPGGGREAAIRGLSNAGYNITLLRDITPVPHNGCRPKKRRRV